MPRTSVLIPSYNHAAFIGNAIDSVVSQTDTDWELIIVDDGSTDESMAVIENVQDSRLRVLQNPKNLGTYGTLQKALSLAGGDYVAVLNSDDGWVPDKLEKQIQILEEHREARLCYCLGGAAQEDGEEANVQGNWPTSEVQELLPFLLEENRVLASSVMFRRSKVGFDSTLRYSGDWDALLHQAKEGPFAFLNESLCFWRQHENNSYVRSRAQLAEEIRVRSWILNSSTSWNSESVGGREISRGLSRCAVHLSALYVLAGKISEARKTAYEAVKLNPSPTSIRRLVQVWLPKDEARKRLWSGNSVTLE